MHELKDYLIVWYKGQTVSESFGIPDGKDSKKLLRDILISFDLDSYLQEGIEFIDSRDPEGKFYTPFELQKKISNFFDFPAIKGVQFPKNLNGYRGLLIKRIDADEIQFLFGSVEIPFLITDVYLGVNYLPPKKEALNIYRTYEEFRVTGDDLKRMDRQLVNTVRELSSNIYLMI